MTDQEYKDFLTALARKHLARAPHIFYGEGGRYSLEEYLTRLCSVAQFAKVVSERSENSVLVKELANELRSLKFRRVAEAMDAAGVLEALDEFPEVTFWHLQRSAIPDEDVNFMQRAGVDDPEVEITLAIHYARNRITKPDAAPSTIVRQAEEALLRAADRLETEETGNLLRGPNPDPEKKKKKSSSMESERSSLVVLLQSAICCWQAERSSHQIQQLLGVLLRRQAWRLGALARE